MSVSIASATCVPLAAAIKAYTEASEQLNFVRDPRCCNFEFAMNPSFYYTIFDSPVKDAVLPLAGRVVNRKLREQLFRWQRGAIAVHMEGCNKDSPRGQNAFKILTEALQRVDDFEKEFSLKSARVSIAPTIRVEPSDGSSRQESPSHTGWGDQTQPLYIEPQTQRAEPAAATRPIAL